MRKRNNLRRSPQQVPVNSPEFIRTFVFDRPPIASDYRNFKVTDLWIHRNPGGDPEYGYYILVDKPNKSAKWIHLGSTEEGAVHYVIPDEGTPVIPDISGKISIIGGEAGVTTTGTTNTLSINVDGAKGDIETLTGDTGSPVSSDVNGNIDILGSNGVVVSGTENTLTINIDGGEGGIITITPDEGDPVVSDIDGDINILGTNGITTSGTLNTLTIVGSGIHEWEEVTVTTKTMEVNHGYIANNASLVTLTLPISSTIGSVVQIDGKGVGGWNVAQNASQIIHFLNIDTTTGITGSISSTERYSNVTLRCITANLEWTVETNVGNLIMAKD